MTILLEQQNRRDLTTKEILQEATLGTLEAYTLEAVLDRVFRSIPDQKQARLAVAFLLFATRPLSTTEFATIMFLGSSIDDGESVSPCWDLFDRLEKQRSAWFAGITVNRHSGVHLAHPRLEAVFLDPETTGSPRYFWHEVASTADYEIAHACLSYLTRSKVKNEQDLLSDKLFAVDSDLGFISYAVKFWPHHFSHALSTAKEEAIESLRQKMVEIDLERWSRTLWLLSNPFNRSRNPWKSPVPALVSLGCYNILQASSASDIALAIEEAARTGAVDYVNNLLVTEDGGSLLQSALLEAIRAASSSESEALAIGLIDRLSSEGRDELSKCGKNLLFRAARLGLSSLAAKLLEIGTQVDPEIPYSQGSLATPLCIAAAAGYGAVVEVLLNHGANVEFRSHLKRTPLSLAAARGNADVIECLVKQGKADIEQADGDNDRKQTQTPFFIACEWGNPVAVEKFIELGVDPSKLDTTGDSPIIVAASYGNWRTIQCLLDHGVDIETAGPGGRGTALRYALANGHVETVRRLLEKGADPSSPRFNIPLLYELAEYKVPMLDGNKISLAKLLLEQHKVDINATTKKGRTALARACTNIHSKLAEFLLGYDPDVNIADKDGYTALFEASEARNLPLVKLLLDKGADANAMTSKGNIPLHMCELLPEFTRVLAERTKDIDFPTTRGLTQLSMTSSLPCF
ncbi:ankyrin repeat-containing domain protein [Xylaria sp. FL0064]|nr:ankyrin repeat-containing domain protein [Xylaria sp. FL0064]